MPLDGLDADEERIGDLPRRVGLGDQLEHLELSGRQDVELLFSAATPDRRSRGRAWLPPKRRIALLDARLAAAEIVTPAADGRVGIGSVVRVRDAEGAAFELELVGPLESDALNGRISMHAPVGPALVGHRVGAHVEVTTPRGRVTLEIVSVRARRGSTGVGAKGPHKGRVSVRQ